MDDAGRALRNRGLIESANRETLVKSDPGGTLRLDSSVHAARQFGASSQKGVAATRPLIFNIFRGVCNPPKRAICPRGFRDIFATITT
jgi:hypothetical protein